MREADMERESRSFEDLAGEAIRDFALSRSVGVVKYGDLLTRLGKGQIQSARFGEEALKLALEESTRYAQDAIKLGGAYLNFVSQLTRAADQQIRNAGATATKAARRAAPKRKRAKSKASA
jgi:hypothetical protein